jgi:arylsulfatase A-like enzyme
VTHRATILTACAVVLALPAVLPAPAGRADDARPNFVLVLVDDLGWTDLGCQGSGYYETPHVDRLAAQGVRFTNAYAACAVCSPTRYAVQTGRYPARSGITDWIRARFQGGAIPENRENPTGTVGGPRRRLLCPRNPLWMEHEEVTIAELLSAAGYATAHIGKWHLGADPWFPETQGYDVNVGGTDAGQPPSYFDPYRGSHELTTLPPRREGEYLTDREADEAAAFIAAHRDDPFFLSVCHYAVHTPIQGRSDLVAHYRAKEKTNHGNAAYAAMVHSVDDALGRIRAALAIHGLTERTWIVFTSDNGGLEPVTDNAPLRAGKGHPYEGGIRVPFIAALPGSLEGGTEVDEPVSSIDILPTICAAAGVAVPGGLRIDGVDLGPLLQGEGEIERDALYWHFPHYRSRAIGPYSIVRRGPWKLIRRYEGEPVELYDLTADPAEQHDLATSQPERARELDTLLTTWLEETGAKLPVPNPDFRPPEDD